eukprot:7257271-Pyramimonas_sp.AAC.1
MAGEARWGRDGLDVEGAAGGVGGSGRFMDMRGGSELSGSTHTHTHTHRRSHERATLTAQEGTFSHTATHGLQHPQQPQQPQTPRT